MAVPTPTIAPALNQAIQKAFAAAREARHEYLTLEHLLLALQEDPVVIEAVAACGGDAAELARELDTWLKARLEALPPEAQDNPVPTLGFNRVMEHAILHTISAERATVDSGAVLVAILQEKESHAAYLLKRHGVSRLTLLRHLSHGKPGRDRGTAPEVQAEPEGEGQPKDPLKAYATDLVARAAAGKIDPLVGREEELERIIHVLCRRRKNNPLLVGEAGVGKTAMAEGLALRIHEGRVPDSLKGVSLFSLDMGSLLAGTRYRGDFEERVKAVLDALARHPGSLLFIDEIHTLVGAGAVSGGSMDASNLLKPILASGDLRCIGATTFQEAKSSIERDRPLARRFQKVEINEPSEADSVAILRGLRPRYEAHHGVRYPDDVLEAAVKLSSRFLRDLALPDKAIDVLDEAGAALKLAPGRKRRKVAVADVEAVVARMARMPLQSVGADDREKLAGLEEGLRAVLFGQDEAVAKVCSAIKLSRSGLRGHDRPVGSFLFAGPTGVGKTELAKQLAKSLEVAFLRFDMSEYMEKHAVSRLIGAPPGYVGFEDGGLLVDAVRRNPHAVLLLDEIEKAHPDIYAILLQVMDHATLTDNHGRRADFRHVTLILTTNAGARNLSQRMVGFGEAGTGGSARGSLEKAFSPEFRNRLDAIVTFGPLGRAEILRVVDKNLRELQALLDEKGVQLEVAPEARGWLADRGYDPAFGARPMARVIEEHVKRPLADQILFGDLKAGGRAVVTLGPAGLAIAAEGGAYCSSAEGPYRAGTGTSRRRR
ncbi:ATP-dependent Clp protease ATP-binding subunit ClpA [Mesoterricola sediminis]|uniref:ATP-dependent Clp protease ATP-binding subunit ClpA n=1 Tax=Mesoterricola sediminis TaxID=2927980 RepID=A0AA48H5L5_9BACT|nr:ATP-dependent Clp protease ATP-binding subunit ClpA [Mesoterricola sediminis]BDU77821.1 ATP-dependent Clp protease ATP-binding subunit ClpA [Mesoterricola sediminis]